MVLTLITELTLFGEHTQHISLPPPPPVCIQDTNASLSSPTLSLMYTWGDSSAYYTRLSREETIAILNDIVQQKIYLKLNKVLPSPLIYPLQQLPDRLRRGPQLKLKRAWSLPCLFKYSPIQICPEIALPLSVDKISFPYFNVQQFCNKKTKTTLHDRF